MAAGIASLESGLVAEELALDRWWAITLAAAGAGLAVRSMVPWPYVVERLYTGDAGPPPTAVLGADAWPDERRGRSAG
jgi:hypothetical protein